MSSAIMAASTWPLPAISQNGKRVPGVGGNARRRRPEPLQQSDDRGHGAGLEREQPSFMTSTLSPSRVRARKIACATGG